MAGAGSNMYDQGSGFWKKYLQGRPQVPESFFERVLAYHREHGGEFGTLHDAGAGVGVHAARLARHFQHVLVSDLSEGNVEMARSYLRQESNCSFRVAKLESVEGLEPGTVDVLFAANVMHHCDVGKAMDAAAHQLKSRGTFVCTGFGILVLDNPEFDAAWDKVFRLIYERMLLDEQSINRTIVAATSYDAVPLPEQHFLPDGLRLRISHPNGWSYYEQRVPIGSRQRIPYISRIGSSEKVMREWDEGWRFTTDVKGLRDTIETFLFQKNDPEIEGRWRELERVIGDREVTGVWPVFLILATKR